MVQGWIGEGMGSSPLRSFIEEAKNPDQPVKCRSCRLLLELEGDDRAAFSEALGDPEIAATMISKALEGYGVRLSASAITRHRRECGPIQ